MDVLMIVLRLIHIGVGVFWAGAVFVTEGFLIPAVRATGPAGGQFMRQLFAVQRFPVRVSTAAIVVILSGLGMYWRNGALSNGAWFQSRQAMGLGIGALAAIVALIPGIGIMARTGGRLAKLGETIQASGAPPTAEQTAMITALQKRIANGSHATAGLVGIAVISMAI